MMPGGGIWCPMELRKCSGSGGAAARAPRLERAEGPVVAPRDAASFPLPGSTRVRSRRAATPLDRDQRDEAEQRGEDQVIARRKRIAGLGDQPGCYERRKAA